LRHVDPGLAAEDAETIVWLLQEVAGSPWLPRPMEQWARSWVASLEELSGGLATTDGRTLRKSAVEDSGTRVV
jgi:hypothetical protein